MVHYTQNIRCSYQSRHRSVNQSIICHRLEPLRVLLWLDLLTPTLDRPDIWPHGKTALYFMAKSNLLQEGKSQDLKIINKASTDRSFCLQILVGDLILHKSAPTVRTLEKVRITLAACHMTLLTEHTYTNLIMLTDQHWIRRILFHHLVSLHDIMSMCNSL